MSAKEDYLEFLERRKKAGKNSMFKYFVNQEKRWIKPFNIFGNVYYVGDSWVCVHLIDTGEGLFLIDAGNCGATAMLIKAIYDLGFKPDDVKWIILSHGHVDHIGAANFFKNMFGTKLYMGKPDADMFKERPEFSLIQESTDFMDDIFEPDVCIQNGDELTFGNTSIKCYIVPGHTEGCVALFFNAYDGGRIKRCGYYGGFGFNTLTKQFLEDFGDFEHNMWDTYLKSIDSVINEHVDIFLGNHTENNKFFEKLDILNKTGSNECFIDENEWRTYLNSKKEELKVFISNQNKV